MSFSPALIALASYLSGEFDNGQQAIADPAWYVHLRLWQRPVSLFTEDSLTLFAEQANIVNLDYPYRPRLLRLREDESDSNCLQVQYYLIKNPEVVRGAGRNPALLNTLTTQQIELLPSCTLKVTQQQLAPDQFSFSTVPVSEEPCCFTYQGETYQVFIGFDVTSESLKTYDKGIDPATGKAIWGALLGPFYFQKLNDFSGELPV